jgi:hypothetical protein
MRNALLAFVCIALLTLAGTALAQTGQGTDDPSTTSAQPSSDVQQSGTTPATSDTGSAATPSGDPPAQGTDHGSMEHSKMPKTASPVPLALAFGLAALGGSAALYAYRLRRAR